MKDEDKYMRTIVSIEPMDNFNLLCAFSDGSIKIADMLPYLKGEAFTPLLRPEAFYKVVNRKLYAEWPEYELDLSADTLWHIGKDTNAVIA
ncbi:MAG: DUF2442 domain-containing protein [Bacteroidota bacterium]|nr:DUF2442 domain-containing protein [Bacteroidota bacterium]